MYRHGDARYRLRQERLAKLEATEKRLVRSCKQIILLNDKIRGLTKRYNQARADGYRSFRYTLRVKIATFEGTRNMFYEYARIRAEDVARLRKELFDENVIIVMGNTRYDVNRRGTSTSPDHDEMDSFGEDTDVDMDDDDDDDDDDDYDDDEVNV